MHAERTCDHLHTVPQSRSSVNFYMHRFLKKITWDTLLDPKVQWSDKLTVFINAKREVGDVQSSELSLVQNVSLLSYAM